MNPFDHELLAEAQQLMAYLRRGHHRLVAAESCTGGLLSALMTELPGSSAVFTHGFITYANEAKSAMLGVPAPLLLVHGAVSEEVARAMAEGALRASGGTIAIAITGVAGPTGGSAEKPVGLVHMACALAGGDTSHQRMMYKGERSAIRLSAVRGAVAMLQHRLQG